MFGFPVKVSWPNIASLPRNVSSSSQQIPSEVSDFPIPNAFSRHWGGVTPPHAPPAIYVPGDRKNSALLVGTEVEFRGIHDENVNLKIYFISAIV